MITTWEKLLTTYAYNILGSYEDAKDVVQDAYLKFMEGNHATIEDKKAYLVRTVSISPSTKRTGKSASRLYTPVNGCLSPSPQKSKCCTEQEGNSFLLTDGAAGKIKCETKGRYLF